MSPMIRATADPKGLTGERDPSTTRIPTDFRSAPTPTTTLQAAAEPKPAAKKTIPSRRGKRAWVTYLDPDTSRRLKAVAAMSDRSMQSLGVEAAELLIERYGTR